MTHQIVKRLTEFLLITSVLNLVYFLVLVPWAFYVIGMHGEQFKTWLWQGFLIDLALGYPAGKLLLYFKDKIHTICRLDEA
jgi:NhaP-type Na+/H+ or K+/H+ antiporter